jgi:hypothetical protein
MRDIQVPKSSSGMNTGNRGVVNAGSGTRPIIPAEQAKKYVAPQQSVKREYFQPKKDNSKKFLALGLFLSLVLISIIFFLATFAFDGATITIKPLKKESGLNETFIVSELDRKDLIQSKSINVTEEITVPKKTTKKVFKKAEGDVVIYNNFSKDTQKFLKGTRLSTTDGKIFKITEAVTVPGKNGNTAGSVKAHVQADVEGVEYNIAPTKFTIPGLKASPKYKDFYAESLATMHGGASGNSNEVGDADLQKGMADMKQKLIESVQSKVGGDVPEGFTYNKETLVLTTGKVVKTSEDDSTATYTQSATGTTLFFKRDEIVKRILEKQEGNNISKPIVKVLDSSKLEVGVSNTSESLDENSQVTLTITGPAPAVYYPNKEAILEYYAGRPVSEFNDITKKFQFIESAKRVIYPFWNTRFPSSIAKIKIEFEE